MGLKPVPTLLGVTSSEMALSLKKIYLKSDLADIIKNYYCNLNSVTVKRTHEV
jgi:hypothetical protein